MTAASNALRRVTIFVAAAACLGVTLPASSPGASSVEDSLERGATETAATARGRCETVSCHREVVIVTANIQQAYADGAPRCYSQDSPSQCNAWKRETAFAKRIIRLAQRERGRGYGDGMGVMPDILLLQEARLKDARHIKEELRERAGVRFAAANLLRSNQVPDSEARVGAWCRKHTRTRERAEECKRRIHVRSGTMILYNKRTMTKIRGSVRHVVSRINPFTESSTCAEWGGSACATWKRHVMAEFAEKRLGRGGWPVGGRTGYRVAVTSVHYSYVINVIHRWLRDRKVKEWSLQIARKMRLRYPKADGRVIGGDFNYERCANKRWHRPGDYEYEPPEPGENGCDYNRWWKTLTSKRRYFDVIHHLHKVRDPETGDVDGRLLGQSRDGCDRLNADGTCDRANEHLSTRRIDYQYVKKSEVVAGSHDLTCGERHPNADREAHCDDRLNPERYSDHVLQWVLIHR